MKHFQFKKWPCGDGWEPRYVHVSCNNGPGADPESVLVTAEGQRGGGAEGQRGRGAEGRRGNPTS